jgi:hypothetical protein
MAAWPSTLPAHLINTFTETPPDNVIRSSVDRGAAKIRKRTTANVRPVSFSMFLTPAQVVALDTFYAANAALEFDYTHPRTGAAVKARFTSPPSLSDINGKNYNCDVALEIMP